MEFGVVRRGGGPKTLILSEEQVDALAEALPTLRDEICCGGTLVEVAGAEWCLPADLTRSRPTARLYVDSHFISLTLQDIEYLSRMYGIVQQELRDYIVALQDV